MALTVIVVAAVNFVDRRVTEVAVGVRDGGFAATIAHTAIATAVIVNSVR